MKAVVRDMLLPNPHFKPSELMGLLRRKQSQLGSDPLPGVRQLQYFIKSVQQKKRDDLNSTSSAREVLESRSKDLRSEETEVFSFDISVLSADVVPVCGNGSDSFS